VTNLRRWLDEDVAEEEADDIILSASEAIAEIVTHLTHATPAPSAYKPTSTTTEYGSWSPAPAAGTLPATPNTLSTVLASSGR
jgi:hypothetical protein